MTRSHKTEAERYQRLAHETRERAVASKDPEMAEFMLKIAEEYERRADDVLRRQTAKGKRPADRHLR